MISHLEVYAGLWIALLLQGVDRFPRQEGVARMQAALERYQQIQRDDPWVAEFLPEFKPGLMGAEDAFKSAVSWGHSAGFCREDLETDEVVIEIDEDLYRNALNHHGTNGPDFHRAMLRFAQAFAQGLDTIWG